MALIKNNQLEDFLTDQIINQLSPDSLTQARVLHSESLWLIGDATQS